jgi:hypothetical protein
MELNKIINNQLETAPVNGVVNGCMVSNLDTEMQLDLGYKETFYFPDPELKEGEYPVNAPFEYDGKIIVDYEIKGGIDV